MTEEELIKDVINYIEDDVNAYNYMIYEDKQEWEDYLKRVFREVKKPLEKKNEELREIINKAIEFLKENADYTGIDFVSDLKYDECLELFKILKRGEQK